VTVRSAPFIVSVTTNIRDRNYYSAVVLFYCVLNSNKFGVIVWTLPNFQCR
jgi:hypothetical protein